LCESVLIAVPEPHPLIEATGTGVVSAIALSIVVPRLLGRPDSSFADGEYRLKLAVFKPH